MWPRELVVSWKEYTLSRGVIQLFWLQKNRVTFLQSEAGQGGTRKVGGSCHLATRGETVAQFPNWYRYDAHF